jgi:uncharacterized protein YbjQ (UPF0145 family)
MCAWRPQSTGLIHPEIIGNNKKISDIIGKIIGKIIVCVEIIGKIIEKISDIIGKIIGNKAYKTHFIPIISYYFS